MVLGPESPLAPEIWQTLPARRPGLAVRTSGGPTSINLFWESLMNAQSHVGAAAQSLNSLVEALGDAAATASPGIGHVHWRVPGFQLRLAAVQAATAGLEELMQRAVTGVKTSHDAYRDAETVVRRLFELLVRLNEDELVLEHALLPQGDKSYVYDWIATTGVLLGGVGVDVLLMRYPAIGAIAGTLMAVERNAGLSPALMGRYEQVLDREPTAEFTHTADGSLSGHLRHMMDVSESGDIAVSHIRRPGEEDVYALYLPGFDFEGAGMSHGRSPMSLIDAYTHGSEHMISAVEQALEQAGVPEGATVLPIGHSLGGSHVINMLGSRRLTERYRFPAAATIGSPGRNTRVNSDAAITHLQDGRDPVPHLFGQRHQESATRLNVVYDVQNPHTEVETPAGSAHTLEHNVEAIAEVEEHQLDWFDDDELEHLDALRRHLDGQVTTTVYRTQWQPMDTPEHLFPWEAESLEDLEYMREAIREGMEEAKQMPRRSSRHDPSTSTPPTVPWEVAEQNPARMTGQQPR